MKSSNQTIAIGITIAFAVFIIWVIYLANTGQPSPFFKWVRLLPYGDKIGHFGLFGLLTLLVNWALSYRTIKIGRFGPLLGTVVVAIFVFLEELSQGWQPNRSLDWQDLVADALGIGLFHWISVLLAKRHKKARG